jgi:hypothetical protein
MYSLTLFTQLLFLSAVYAAPHQQRAAKHENNELLGRFTLVATETITPTAPAPGEARAGVSSPPYIQSF